MKNLFIFVLLTLQTIYANSAPKKILMMVSEGFYAPEYFIPLKAFKSAGHQVTTATKYPRVTKPDERQIDQYPAVIPDITFSKINYKEYDAIVFAGGNGAWEDFFPNETVHRILADFYNSDKIVALLCSSTGLLGVANNLDGHGVPIAMNKKVTGYKRVEGLLKNLGKVNFIESENGKPFVVIDGNLITGKDPSSSELFAQKIIEKLK